MSRAEAHHRLRGGRALIAVPVRANIRGNVLNVLLMGCRHASLLRSLELTIDDRVLLGPPHVDGLRLDVFDPAFDALDALLADALVFLVELLMPVCVGHNRRRRRITQDNGF